MEQEMSDWQPIATAPRDVIWIKVRLKNGDEQRAHFAQDLSCLAFSRPIKRLRKC